MGRRVWQVWAGLRMPAPRQPLAQTFFTSQMNRYMYSHVCESFSLCVEYSFLLVLIPLSCSQDSTDNDDLDSADDASVPGDYHHDDDVVLEPPHPSSSQRLRQLGGRGSHWALPSAPPSSNTPSSSTSRFSRSSRRYTYVKFPNYTQNNIVFYQVPKKLASLYYLKELLNRRH